MILDKNAINAVSDTEYDYVDVPEWGDGAQVKIRSLFGDQRQRLFSQAEKSPCWDALCCSMGMVDSQGAQLYAEPEMGNLAKKHPEVLSRICRGILALSNMTKASRAEAEKKSQTTLTSNGGSGSPAESTPATDSTLTPSSETPPAVSLSDGKPTTE